MKNLITICLIISGLTARSQTIEKQVIGNLGGISSGGSYSVDCTVGETAVDTFSSGSILLYQGYHHPADTVNSTSVPEIKLMASAILFPNPTSANAILRISGASVSTNLLVQVYSLEGKLISTSKMVVNKSSRSETSIDLGSESAGVYLVRITDKNSLYTQSLRLTKQ